MNKLLFTLLLAIGTQFSSFAQIEMKSEAEILQGIEWLTTNPVDQTDSLFVGIVSDNIMYQMMTYPGLPVYIGALSELMDSDFNYEYLDEMNIVFVGNMLAQKIKTDTNFNYKYASYQSILKVLNYYERLLSLHPEHTNPVLDEYSAMKKEDLEKRIKKLAKK